MWTGGLVCVLYSGVVLGAVSTVPISLGDLQQARWSGPLTENSAFAPAANAADAHTSFVGTLSLSETRMTTLPPAFKSATVLGRDPQLFPAVNLTFVTVGHDLVPVSQELISAGSSGRGRSYWDLIVQPGAVWSTPEDRGWSRGGFPFALVNSLEGETHNGLATFAYKDGTVSNLRLQIVQQTAPFYVPDYFTAAALIPAKWVIAPSIDFDIVRRRYQRALTDPLPVAPWQDLEARIAKERLENFEDGYSAADILVSALDYHGTVYLKPCQTPAGPLPWCERARFGVWSATKSLVAEVALLRLAQKYGPSIFEERIVDFVPGASHYPGWQRVRFQDAANMATGLGNGSLNRNPNNILDGGLEHYAPWYEARSAQEKIHAALTGAEPFPWGPQQVARYRDQDIFMLGVALDRYVKKKEGADSSVWSLLQKEVFEPIGIQDAPINKTLEFKGQTGQPLMAFGFYPTISDIVRIARLYQSSGIYQGQQLLYAPKIKEILARVSAPGLPTGQHSPAGENYYFNTFWKTAYRTSQGCKLYYPQMEGWGGTVVALFPGKLTGIRIAKIWDVDGDSASATAGMADVADHLKSFCP
jgi:CubicO group peptidase (beta-lactamase class C family)